MSSEIKNLTLIGAGGNLGPTILKTLRSESPFQITVLSREDSKSTFPEGVNVVRANYDSIDSLKSAFKGQDAVISLVGGTAIGDQNKLIDAAIAAGVKVYIPSEFGSNTKDDRLLKIVPVFAGKRGTVDYLKSKEDSIAWTAVITGPFFDWGLKVGFLGFNAAERKVRLVDNGEAKWTATNLRQIGRSLIKILQKPNETKNQYVYVASVETTQNEVLSVAEKITGSKWTTENIESSKLQESGNEKLKKHDYSGIPDLIVAGIQGKAGLGDNSVEGLWNEKLGLEKEDLEESVKAGLAGKLVGDE